MYVEYEEGVQSVTTAPCSFWCDEGSEIFFPPITNLYGERTIFEGLVTGVENLIIAGT